MSTWLSALLSSDLDSAEKDVLTDIANQAAHFEVTFDAADQCPETRIYPATAIQSMLDDVRDHLEAEDATVSVSVGYNNRWTFFLGGYDQGEGDPALTVLLSLFKEDSDA